MTTRAVAKSFADVPDAAADHMDVILLDTSASMYDKWHEMLSAIDTYVRGVRTEGITAQVRLTTFDSPQAGVKMPIDTPIHGWTSCMGLTCNGGSTALYDAIGSIATMLRDDNPPKASIVIVTDGDENASQITDETQARAYLDWMRAKGWQVTFIGCDFNNSRQAQALGATPAAAIGVAKARLSDAADALAKKRAAYGRTGQDMHFSDDEKQTFGGYLAGPSR